MNTNALNLEDAIQVAHALFDTKSVQINVENPFTYVSGMRSPIYCDNRHILGYAKERDIIVEAYLKAIPEDVEVIVGVATAGIPWASIIADRLHKPLAYVRSKPKEHGRGRQIEGADVAGKKIIIIEDLITTGKSSLVAVNALKAENVASLEVLAIFSYGFQKAIENYQDHQCTFRSLSNFHVLIEELEKSAYLTPEQASTAKLWSADPDNWAKDHGLI